ncbi:MAG: hypothetical protein OES24_20720 [Acidimicrobiia bacterium]|nr:hypothetical protein [Acidimicrobiia bacterium]
MRATRRRTKLNSPSKKLAALLVLAVALVHGPPAAAADITGIRITGQSAFVAPNGSFVIEIVVDGDPIETGDGEDGDGLELAVTVFDRIRSESEVEEPPSRAASRLEPVALADLTPNGANRYRLEIPVQSSSDPIDDLPRLQLAEVGVYPVNVELRSAEGVVAATRTNLIRLPRNPTEETQPLKVATVLPVVPAEGITIADAQQLLATHPDLPVTVLLGSGVVSQLTDDPTLTAGFAEALGDRPLVATPDIDLDPSALAAIGQMELYDQAMTATVEQLTELGLTPVTDITVITEQLTGPGAEALIESGVAVVIDASSSPAPNGYVTVDGRRLYLLRYDGPVSGVFGKPSSGVSQANEALARLTVRGQSNRSPVVVGGASLGPRPARGLHVFFRALAHAGAPQPVLLPDATASSFERQPAEYPRQDLASVSGLIEDSQALLASYEMMYSGGGIGPDDYRVRLQSALSLARNPADRQRALVVFADELGRELEVISLPDAQAVTMAARQGSIPLIVESRAAGPRLVKLHFRSDKVVVKQDSQLIVVEPGTSSIDVEVEALSLGASQLEVSVWTPDGARVLATNQFQVRSTAVPGLGLLISAAALVFLVVWWFVDHRRDRIKRIESRAAHIIGDAKADRGGPAAPTHPEVTTPATIDRNDPSRPWSRDPVG